MAAVLTHGNIKGKGIFRVIFYIPSILSVVVISAIFSAIYDPSRGLLTIITSLFTNDPVLWLGDRKLAIYSIGIAMVWQAVGYYMIMYMAGMSSVPISLYEASSIEGAGKARQFFTITIPLIWENIRTTLTFFIISNINISFLIVRTLTGGGPDSATHVFLSYMYDQAYTNSSYGYGMAIGVFAFIFSFGLSLIINSVTKREITTV
jgi:N-acetylglucosamine transport system permease protein